jgi:acyl-CoA hydrolase
MPVELSLDKLDLTRWVRAGDGVVWGQACAEPVVLVDALLAQAPEALSVFVGLSWRELDVPARIRVVSYGALGRLGRLAQLEVVPCHYSALPGLFAARTLPGDVALVQVSPPDRLGRCSFGVGADYVADAVRHARTVIAEVNDHCPATAGEWIDYDRLDAAVHTSRPLVEAPAATPGEIERRIAEHVAALVDDGDTIQLGVGALPEAILGALAGHRDLGVHSGMVSDGILDLIEAGAVTNARKAACPNVSVTGAALGSRRLFAALGRREDIVFKPASFTHAPKTLAKIGPLAAINSAVEVDLVGQVNSESAGGRRIGAVGGQVDFLRAAAKPIIALPAKRIVRALSGPVSTSRTDVDWVVTEHGARSLAGLSDIERQSALLELAGAGSAAELHEAGVTP